MKLIKLMFCSELFNVKSALNDILDFLDKYAPSISPSDKSEIRLIFSELLCNAVIHGNNEDSNKKVCLSVDIIDDVLHATVCDEGAGFNYDDMLSEKTEYDEYNETGRGIQLVRSLTDHLYFNSSGNIIFFKKRVRMVE